MKYVKILGLCLVAVLALSLGAATAASARRFGIYEDGTEEPAIGFKYTGKDCSAKVPPWRRRTTAPSNVKAGKVRAKSNP